MRLRTKLAALSLLTLLLPWSAWKLLQELEGFLREAQESAMITSARTLAGALPVGFQTQLMFLPDSYLPLRRFVEAPVLDGYLGDWTEPGQGLEFTSQDGQLDVRLLAGSHDNRLYLAFDVRDREARLASSEASSEPGRVDGISLRTRNPRGLFSYTIQPRAPGPLQLRSDQGTVGQAEGFWLDLEAGYRVELVLPLTADNTDISFLVNDGSDTARGAAPRTAGPRPLADGRPAWLSLIGEWQSLSAWFRQSEIDFARTWLVDTRAWVLADSGPVNSLEAESDPASPRTTWLQRFMYRLVTGSRTELLQGPPANSVRLGDAVVQRALAGDEAVSWTQEIDNAVVWNTVAVPLVLEGGVRGAIVMQAATDGLLLVTNRTLGRLLFSTLALTLGLAAGLWYFASRLSQRVQRLSGAVSEAMEDTANPGSIPLQEDRDELGELARNNQKLLRAVADYSQYLQTLAGKLSHELKTPLAITRSSLDNLSSQELNSESRRFLERAREGVDRQAAIVRAMSEANRLEAAIGAAEWEEMDLAALVGHCAEAYRTAYPGRRLETRLPASPLLIRCAPDLLAQALDKLVDNAMSLSGEQDTVSVTLEAEGGEVRLSVRNTGTGLPGELEDRLFDSLVSLRAKRGAGPHLGLGLYIVRLVATAHDGDVTARNLPDGQGVEFQILLPAKL